MKRQTHSTYTQSRRPRAAVSSSKRTINNNKLNLNLHVVGVLGSRKAVYDALARATTATTTTTTILWKRFSFVSLSLVQTHRTHSFTSFLFLPNFEQFYFMCNARLLDSIFFFVFSVFIVPGCCCWLLSTLLFHRWPAAAAAAVCTHSAVWTMACVYATILYK